MRNEKREADLFNNHGVVLTLIIHWLGPPFFYRGDLNPG